MTKEREIEVRKLLHDILDIVLDCNGLEERQQSKTGSMPTAFLRFSGHVGAIEVEIHPDGWSRGGSAQEKFDTYCFDKYFDTDFSEEWVEKLRRYCDSVNVGVKKQSEVLERDIMRREKDIEEAKKEIADIKRKYKEAVKNEQADRDCI